MKAVVMGLFVVLLFGSLYFALERILFIDASYIFFRILNLNALQIQEYRYGSFITQAVPLLAARLHLPLSVIVTLYSMSFNLFYGAVAALLLFRFKEYGLAILMAFYYTLFVSDTWFWSNNEVHQGIAWMFLFFAVVLYMGKYKTHLAVVFPLFCALAFLAIYTHPLVLFPCVFLWLFFAIQKEQWPFSKTVSILLSVVLAVICVSKFVISANVAHYDSDKLIGITNLTMERVQQAVISPVAKEIVKRSIANYWILPLLFIAGVISGIRQKKYLPLVLTVGFCMAYLIAVTLTFQNFLPFYTESELMPLTIIAAAPFVYYTLPGLRPKTVTLLLAAIFLVRLAYIGAASQTFVARKNWIVQTLQAMREQHLHKAVVYQSEANDKVLLLNWGVPAESLVASALLKDHPNLTFVVDKPESIKQRMPSTTRQMISCFELWDARALNPYYFSIDTASTYGVVKEKQ